MYCDQSSRNAIALNRQSRTTEPTPPRSLLRSQKLPYLVTERSLALVIDDIHQLSQAADFLAVELESQSRQGHQVGFVLLQAKWSGAFDSPRFEQVGELGIQSCEQVIADVALQSQHQLAADEPHAVISAVKV